jgi:hypothetical protein
MPERWRSLAQVARRHGPREAVRYAVSEVGKRLVQIEVHRVRLLELARTTRELPRDPRFESRFLTVAEVRRFADDPANDLSPAFAELAARGHLCFAALLDGRLASYTWYAVGSIEPEHSKGVRVTFPEHTAYAYKAYTRPEHRGLHLQGRLKQPVIDELLERGIHRRLGLIEWTNWPSLRSSDRSGYRDLGVLVTQGRRRILHRPAAAAGEGIGFEAPARG